jgi:hypothetical protein
MKDAIELSAVIEDMEIRGVRFGFPGGPVDGFEWRYRVTIPPTSTSGPKDEWTQWIFGSRPSVEKMVEKFQHYLRDGTLGPGTQVQ